MLLHIAVPLTCHLHWSAWRHVYNVLISLKAHIRDLLYVDSTLD